MIQRHFLEIVPASGPAQSSFFIYEVAISYHDRTYAEGKKIGWKDGISALRCILKYGLLR